MIGLLLLVACSGTGNGTPPPCPSAAPTSDQARAILVDAKQAVVSTNKGSFTIQLLGDTAPIATANFVALARCGFYSQITFHRVVAGYVIQAGDPQSKASHGAFPQLGTGGPGYGFAIENPPDGTGYDKYTVAMANAAQPDTNGSQFFIDLADLNAQLTRSYTIFGKVTEGTDVVDAIGQVPTNGTPSDTAQNVPLDPVIINSITIQGGS